MTPPRPSLRFLSRRLAAGLLAAVLAAASACDKPPPPPPAGTGPAESAPAGPPLFRDVTAESGVRATYRNGEEAGRYTILEAMGGGVALLDYDGDGLLDVLLPGGGYFEGDEIRGHSCK